MKLLFLFLIVIFSSCSYPSSGSLNQSENPEKVILSSADNDSTPPGAELGKSYLKYMQVTGNRKISNWTKVEYTSEFIYTGSFISQAGIDKKLIQSYRPAGTRWEKKRAERNCLSADPNDCQVWCLIEEPASNTFSYIYVVRDTHLIKNYKVDFLINKTLLNDEPIGTLEWKEVLNPTFIKLELYSLICQELQSLGAYPCSNATSMTEELEEAIIQFQKDNNIPQGGIDCKTLELLGIDYCK